MKVEFSHRYDEGISIGIAVNNNMAFFAHSFVNFEAGDTMNRRTAVRLIRARIFEAVRLVDSGSTKISSVVSTFPAKGLTALQIVNGFRDKFQEAHFTFKRPIIVDSDSDLVDKLNKAISFIETGTKPTDFVDITPQIQEGEISIPRDQVFSELLDLVTQSIKEKSSQNVSS